MQSFENLSTPHHSTACTTTFIRNNMKFSFSLWSLTLIWRNFLFYNVTSVLSELLRSHHSISIGPLLHLHSFPFKPFSLRFAAALSWCTNFIKSFSCQTDSLIFYTLLYRVVHGQLNHCKVSKSCSSKTSPNHHLSIIVLTAGMRCLW